MKRSTENERLRDEAKRAMWTYYKDNKAWIPKWIREYREEIIEGISAGNAAAGVFDEIISRVEKELAA